MEIINTSCKFNSELLLGTSLILPNHNYLLNHIKLEIVALFCGKINI